MDQIIAFFAAVDFTTVPNVSAEQGQLKNLVNAVFAIMGAIAVLIIVIAGLRYIFSQGDPSTVTASRNAILYAVIGLVVIIAAYAIVNFVVLGVS